MNDEILTVSEIATFLKMKELTVIRALRSGRIPRGFKLNKEWRIRKSDLDEYIDEQIRKNEKN